MVNFQSSDEDGGHTIRSAIAENTTLRANFMAIHFTEPELLPTKGKVFRIGTVRYNWPMSVHESQAFIIAHCTDSEDLPTKVLHCRNRDFFTFLLL